MKRRTEWKINWIKRGVRPEKLIFLEASCACHTHDQVLRSPPEREGGGTKEKKSRASISNIAGLLLGRSPPKVENLHLGLVIIWGTTLDAIGIVLV